MQSKNTLLVAAVAALSLVSVSMTASTVVLSRKLAKIDKKAAPAANVAAKPDKEPERLPDVPPPPEETASAAAPTNAVRRMSVKKISYEGHDRLKLFLSERPDMSVVRQYVTVEPLERGAVSFGYETPYDFDRRKYMPALVVTGDFMHRTNVTLCVRKGFPAWRKAGGTASAEPLEEDFVHVFSREDEAPSVSFADGGRYLPPLGRRAVAISSVNVPSVHAEVREVPSANIVQMLALEERAYNHVRRGYWLAEEEFVEDLSAESVDMTVDVRSEPNERVSTPVVVEAPGAASSGVFLVTVRRGDRERNDDGWGKLNGRYGRHDELYNPNRYRVVCVTDLGLSVRKTKSGLLAWVTSLATGRPVAGAVLEAYSTANALVAKGRADENGLCRLESVAKGEPFAVVASAADGSDRSFIALRSSMSVDEPGFGKDDREKHLSGGECAAFVWTERGIYRHDERIFMHAILRDGTGKAPRPFPVEAVLLSPEGNPLARKMLMPDEFGAVSTESFSVPEEQPSGSWSVVVKTPGKDGAALGERKIKVEEFAPPQIRVKVAAEKDAAPAEFAFSVSAEHLYGGPAKLLKCEGAVVFQDVPFSPSGWKGYLFGNDELGLKPSFRRLAASRLDGDGKARFQAPLWADSGRPKAAVKAIGEGTVFEDGGRPATARASCVLHYYPFYIGATMPGRWVSKPETGRPSVRLACVRPDGSRAAGERRLVARLERVDYVYTYRRRDDGWATWDCDRVRNVVADAIPVVAPDGADAELEIPADECGDYVLVVEDPASGASFGSSFYLGGDDGDRVAASLSNPTSVSLSADRDFYRPGERPRLVVKSPFAGTALVSVFRDDLLYTEVVPVGATGEVELRPMEADWAPGVDVKVSVVQSAAGGRRGMSVRAHGEKSLSVRRAEDELPVKVSARVDVPAGNVVDVDVSAVWNAATGAVAVVTVVDEGINLLTDEPVPDPIGRFATMRGVWTPLYDLYHRLLPVLGDDDLRASGAKTGGGEGAEMLGRVSPAPTRRFRPLAVWRERVPLDCGKGSARFVLPEFVGEVRVTAVAYDSRATGAGSCRAKVAPALVMQPDAPRFVAPGDVFEATLPITNTTDADGDVEYEVVEAGRGGARFAGSVRIARGDTSLLRFSVTAPAEPGEMDLRFSARGLGESHSDEIHLPVRPAVAWRETAGVEELAPGASYTRQKTPRFKYEIVESPAAGLRSALEWLADYPHGCLEQTSSRIMPLVAAKDVLCALGSSVHTNVDAYVAAGVKRVSSMIRNTDFVMWPDCNYAPWDREVSLYAAHFLVAAEKSGARLDPASKAKVGEFLSNWAMSPTNSISAYACHTLALAGRPERDRMLRLYDDRSSLSLLSRARLARAFAAIGDRVRATELLKSASAPASVKEAAFALVALLELGGEDARVRELAAFLAARRDPQRFAWGTTEENAHALAALAAYYRKSRPSPGTRFVCWRALELPELSSVTNETSDISVTRRFLGSDGCAADMSRLSRGDLLFVELTVRSEVARDYSDLVIEDLFAGAMEPVHSALDPSLYPWLPPGSGEWVMRSDARDDRMLVFSKRFHMEKNDEVKFCYPLRVVSGGEFALPGVAAEAMYQPSLRARTCPGRVVVRD